MDAILNSRCTKTQQGNCDLTYCRWGGFPDLPAFPKHTGKVCFLELHRQPAATGTPFIISKNKILIYQIILSSKTSLFYHKSIIHQPVSVAPNIRNILFFVVSTVILEKKSNQNMNFTEMKETEQHPAVRKYCSY